MSEAAFSYGSLRDAASDARGVAKRCNAYADSIERTVRDKLDKYKGDWSGDLGSARRKAEEKMDSLRETADQYQALSDSLSELRDACKRTDKAVRSEVSSLTASFKKAHDIHDSVVINYVSFFLTKWKNSSALGRWLNVGFDKAREGADYLTQRIKAWYNYEGGRTLVVNTVEILAGLAIAIASAFLSGGIVAIITAAIVLINSVTDLINEGFAYYCTKYGDDPAMGKRFSNISTFANFLRIETNSKALHLFATGLDITAFVCAAITLTQGLKDLVGRGLRWANNTAKLSFRDYFSKANWSNFLSKAKESLKVGAKGAWNDVKDLFRAAKSGNFTNLQNVARITKQSFLKSLKDFYTLDFSSQEKAETAIKNIAYLMQGVSFTLDSHSIAGALAKLSLSGLILPGIGGLEIFHPNELDIDESGQVFWNLDGVKLADFGERLEEFTDDALWETFSIGHILKGDIRRKLAETSKVNIALPSIIMPDLSKVRRDSPDFSVFFALNPITVPTFRLERVDWKY